ncbi:27215_t:CDS:1, partial [Dentiscutata erythropus]
ALKESMKLGNKGARKHISKKVLQYLQDYFLVGNLEAADYYFPKDIYVDLKNLAKNNKLLFKEIPTIKTIKR